jgi:AcrR family transcriptional regulator
VSDPLPDLNRRRASRREVLQERVSTAILAAAAEVLSARGAGASMTDVANRAGMARATVYRYFPTRQALLDRLAEVAVSDAAARLQEARLDSVPPEEALIRAVRSFFDVGDYFIVVANEGVRTPARAELIERPLKRMFSRGQKAGAFRSDAPPDWLAVALVSLVESVMSLPRTKGRDDMVALVSKVFLDGIREQSGVSTARGR